MCTMLHLSLLFLCIRIESCVTIGLKYFLFKPECVDAASIFLHEFIIYALDSFKECYIYGHNYLLCVTRV